MTCANASLREVDSERFQLRDSDYFMILHVWLYYRDSRLLFAVLLFPGGLCNERWRSFFSNDQAMFGACSLRSPSHGSPNYNISSLISFKNPDLTIEAFRVLAKPVHKQISFQQAIKCRVFRGVFQAPMAVRFKPPDRIRSASALMFTAFFDLD